MLFAALEYRLRAFCAFALPVSAVALSLWLSYFLFYIRPHFLLDYRYLFSANSYTGMTRENALSAIFYTLHGVAWMGRLTTILIAAATLLAALQVRKLRKHPMIVSLLLWAAGYGAFLAYHNNLQPRYYLVVAVPLSLLVPVVFEDLVLPRFVHARSKKIVVLTFAMCLAFIVVPDAVQTVEIVRHPQYTFLAAARRIHDIIAEDHRKDPKHSDLLLSISGSDISLMTGLRTICDDFGTSELEDRVNQYQPGWYASWNLIEDDKMDALDPQFHVERVATIPAMDDSDRNVLILYRLDRADAFAERSRRSGRRRSRTKVGQRPSTSQLKH